MLYLNYLFLSIWVDKLSVLSTIVCFHMTSWRPHLCPKTMKRRPCLCPKPILWELNSFLMQTLSFVPINLHRCWQREWKHSINKPHSRKTLLESSKILVMTIGLSVNECLHLKKPENKIDLFRSSGRGDFKGLTRFRQSLPKISSIIKKWKRGSGCARRVNCSNL